MMTESDDWDSEDLESDPENSEEDSEDSENSASDWDLEDLENNFMDNLKDPEGRIVMRLHIVRGSLFTTSDYDMEGGCPSMDAALWSKLPEDIIWKVVQLVPAAKHFQWRSVSRKWQQVLTSPDFAAASRESEERRLFACVTRPGGHGSSRRSKLKVLDIDLSSFVPSWFWKPDRLAYIQAAANGLVCICNDQPHKHKKETTQYCVVNPLTRSCIVLPKPPFQPWHWLFPSSSTLTICGGNLWKEPDWKWATYDLATSGAGGWHLAVYHIEDVRLDFTWRWVPPVLCAGEGWRLGRLQLAPCPGPDRPLVEVAAVMGIPSVTLLGLNPASHDIDNHDVYLVAHGHTLFFIARLRHYITPLFSCDAGCGVFWLARDRMEWEAVARLDVSEVERLTGWDCRKYELRGFDCIACGVKDCRHKSGVFGACWVQNLLCCNYVIPVSRRRPRGFGFWRRGFAFCLLGLNVDTGEWHLVNDDKALAVGLDRVDKCLPTAVDAFELRLDRLLPESL